MAERKVGTTISRVDLSPILALFRLSPEPGDRFPRYTAGQYIALRREDCRLTKRILQPGGGVVYVPDLDEHGKQKRGPVTHSYSISSAPYETEAEGWLEFYIILEMHQDGKPGRLTESLFHIDPSGDNRVTYFTKIAGDFTLDSRAAGFQNIVFVGTGTGLAPFASMVKQLHFEAPNGAPDARYTLFHGNRNEPELAYHSELLTIEKSGKLDFVYVPSVSRPSPGEQQDPALGKGRANNLLRLSLDLPLKEEEDLQRAQDRNEDPARAKTLLEKAVRPVLPRRLSHSTLRERMTPGKTVILTCGNPKAMEDIQYIAEVRGMNCEKEVW